MITNNHLEVLARDHIRIEPRIGAIETQEGGLGQLCRSRHHNDVFGTDTTDDCRAQLLIAATEHKSLCSNRTKYELAITIPTEEIKDLALRQVRSNDLAVDNSIDAEERLLDVQRVSDRLHGTARAKEEEGRRPRFDFFLQFLHQYPL
jgi:hypothetical protein